MSSASATVGYNTAELVAVMSARFLEDGKIVFGGAGLPLVACILAQKMHAPGLTILFEGGVIGPQVEVSKSRITNIDLAIQEQDRAIAREKVNTKPTKLDSTLNSPAVSKALAIFGGSSSEERSGVAQERIRLMQEEKDLLETMRLAHTPEERADLQKELDDLRAQRRELDQVPR